MVITSHMSHTSKAAIELPRSAFWLLALLLILIFLIIPATAWGDIYKWTDEQGRINISNVPPPSAGKARNVEIVLKEVKPTEQELLARIERLERQQQARQYPAQAPGAPPPTPYGSYYPPTPPPPPPPNYYDSGYDAGYDSGYYSSGYYPSYPSYYPTYSYPVVPAYSYAAYPRRAFISRPVFAAPRGGAFRGGGGFSHGGGGSFRGGGGHGGGHGGRR